MTNALSQDILSPTSPRSHQPVDYNDELHRYSYDGYTYCSATQLIEKFKHHFDVEERSLYMADRYGNTPQYWKDKWKNENGKSLIRGNNIHDKEERELYRQRFIEVKSEQILSSRTTPFITPTQILPVTSYDSDLSYYNLPDAVYPEMLLWRHDYGIAGRSDKVILQKFRRYPGTVDRIAHIEDYKTNKAIRQYSYEDKSGYRMMLGPLSHLMDCEWVYYALQLSIYQFMLEWHGFFPGNRRIIHFPHEIEGLGTPRPKVYELPYLRDEVIAMLECYINNNLPTQISAA